MEQFSSEEQQVEAIKKFWKDNGMAIVLGAVLGLGGLYGWRAYNDSQITAREASSDAYQSSIAQIGTDPTLAQQFVTDNTDSSYAVLAAMQLAKQAIDAKDLAEAEKQLSWVQSHSEQASIKAVATLRLARVQLEQEELEKALNSLSTVADEAFIAQAEEIKGDVYLRQGDIDKARSAYSQSLEKNSNNGLLKMKLDNLASNAKA